MPKMANYGNYKHLKLLCTYIRNNSTSVKPKVIPDQNVLKDIQDEVYKPRKHPGILQPRQITLPESFVKAVTNVLEDYPVKSLIEDGKVLSRHLKGKRPPVEKEQFKKTTQSVKERVLSSAPQHLEINSEEDRERVQQSLKDKVRNILWKEVYHWKAVNYDAYNSLVYLMARAAPEYAVLVKIFAEIAERDPNFKPRSLFDFGSGVGTVTWAAINFWKKNIFQYFNVDASVDMNDLAQILLQKGRGTNQMELRGVFYRQFLPASHTTYDLVVSAYSLMELPSQKSRLETIYNLWNRTQNYLVIVEQGTNFGFHVINEARDFILHQKNDATIGHVFSPCPHDEICPRFMADDNTPCNFQIHYDTLPVGAISQKHSEKYSYVVFKKGKKDSSDPEWPRVVRETLVRSKHAICRMCTKHGQLQEVIFTASKHGKSMYHCARATKWGDMVPVSLGKSSNNENDYNNEDITLPQDERLE